MGGARLAAVALIVPDYDPAIAFFTAIGFRLAEDVPATGMAGPKRWVTVEGGEMRLVLARAETAEERAAIGRQWAGRVGLFLRVRDFEGTARAITAAGGHFEEAPRREPYGTVAIWRDLWGNRWDLIGPD